MVNQLRKRSGEGNFILYCRLLCARDVSAVRESIEDYETMTCYFTVFKTWVFCSIFLYYVLDEVKSLTIKIVMTMRGRDIV